MHEELCCELTQHEFRLERGRPEKCEAMCAECGDGNILRKRELRNLW